MYSEVEEMYVAPVQKASGWWIWWIDFPKQISSNEFAKV